MKVVKLLGLQGLWWRKVCRDSDCLCPGVMSLSESFFEPVVAGDQSLFGQSFSIAPPVQALRGLPYLGSFSAVLHVRHIEGPPLDGVLLCRLAC